MAMDPAAEMDRMRRLAAAPDWVVGSVHAVTRDGDLVIASASGSQLASIAYGGSAGVACYRYSKGRRRPRRGGTAYREYSLPLEDARARMAYGMGSAVHKVLTLHGDPQPGRLHVLLVDEPLGF
jgi:hypothetical protein